MQVSKTDKFIPLIRKLLETPNGSLKLQTPEGSDLQEIDKQYLLDLFISGFPADLSLSELLNLELSEDGKKKTEVLEQLLRANMRRFISIFDSLHDGVLIADSNEVVRYINKSFERITGARFDDIVGKVLSIARPGARLGGIIRSQKPMFAVKRAFGNTEYITDMHPIFINDVCVGGITIARDITEIQQLQEKLGKYRIRYSNLLRKVHKEHTALYTFNDIVGKSITLNNTKTLASRLATSDIPVLIRGESGTGKELFAHAIHSASPRANQPFIIVNCAAIPTPLLESELFGYADGAFSGARKGGKQGLIALADSGSLFLDEIGDLDVGLQAKLLRVIQSGEMQPVGSEKTIRVDIRIIAATNVDLEKKILEEKFRSDLFYRLNAAQVIVPPLRVRKDDILSTAEHFLQKHFIEHTLGPLQLSARTKAILENYHWPGNVRELENTIQFIGSITEKQIISSQYLPSVFHSQPSAASPTINVLPAHIIPATAISSNLKKQRLQHEAEMILAELKKHGSSVEAKKLVAKQLGISLTTLYSRLSILNEGGG